MTFLQKNASTIFAMPDMGPPNQDTLDIRIALIGISPISQVLRTRSFQSVGLRPGRERAVCGPVEFRFLDVHATRAACRIGVRAAKTFRERRT